jgi:hypothetical protein
MLQMTQKMKPYTKLTDPPEGMTMPIDPARDIQVLWRDLALKVHKSIV